MPASQARGSQNSFGDGPLYHFSSAMTPRYHSTNHQRTGRPPHQPTRTQNIMTASSVASAPGKCILFGEHSVVYGYPAVAAALSDLRIYVEAALHADGPFMEVVLCDLPSAQTGTACSLSACRLRPFAMGCRLPLAAFEPHGGIPHRRLTFRFPHSTISLHSCLSWIAATCTLSVLVHGPATPALRTAASTTRSADPCAEC